MSIEVGRGLLWDRLGIEAEHFLWIVDWKDWEESSSEEPRIMTGSWLSDWKAVGFFCKFSMDIV